MRAQSIRLLKRLPNGCLELVSFDDEKPPPYAILSHTWDEGKEVSYSELKSGTGKDKAGYDKIRFCVDKAAEEDELFYSWVDTCCIDKTDFLEFSMAMNSMFRWYQRAKKCYVYLSDVSVSAEVGDPGAFPMSWAEAFYQSYWFTRCWTLQELLAPPTVEFFSKEGKLLGSKSTLEKEIHKITKIPTAVLCGKKPLSEIGVDERMSWVAGRNATIRLDKVYCLLGIFEVFLPLICGESVANATSRLLEEIQKRQKGRGAQSLQSLPVSIPLPFPPNELFVGREEQLQSLEQFLDSPDRKRMSMYGLGGCGKSALAIEFAYRTLAYGGRFVLWVPAISRESFEQAYRDIGTLLQIPGITNDNANIKQLVKSRLSSDGMGQWLMIVDNADDSSVLLGGVGSSESARLFDYIPYSTNGKVLFTTRSRISAADLTPSNIIKLSDMRDYKDEAQELLKRRISHSHQALIKDPKAVGELLDKLDYLPLAIVQAAAYMDKIGISAFRYISLLREVGSRSEVFGERFEDHSRYLEMDNTIAKTWHISFDQIQREDALAAEYLSFMGCVDRINIPQSLLPPADNLLRHLKAIGTLKGFEFITEGQQASQELGSQKLFNMHQLVHMATELWLDRHGERTTWTATAARRLEELIPDGGHERKEVWMAYLPHATHVGRPDGRLDEIARASLLNRLGWCQATLGQYSRAELTHQDALSLRERKLGEEHDQTLISMNHVGEARRKQGKYKAAETMHMQVIKTRKKVFGARHPSTLTSMGKLASTYRKQGRWTEAKELQEQVMETSKMVLGAEHRDTLNSMVYLALIYENQGRLRDAEELETQVMEIRKRGPYMEDQDTLIGLGHLALIYRNQGRLREAEELETQVMGARKRVLGAEHPETLVSMGSLAVTYRMQGRLREAEELIVQVIADRKRVLGAEHKDTLTSIGNLALTFRDQGRVSEAKELQEQVMETSKKALGAEHPDTLTSMHNLAFTWKAQGKSAEAISLMDQCLQLRTQILDTDHPHILSSSETLRDWRSEDVVKASI